MKFPVISFEQPIGTLLLTIMSVPQLIKISKADPRKYDAISMETIGGIQREPSSKRIIEIARYAETVDATFPTPILLALEEGTYELDGDFLIIKEEKVADIVDGQHRVLGLGKSGVDENFIIPVVFLLNVTEEQKALIFATINGKQTKVPASLIYDLFGVTKTRSPQKTAHEIARALNSTSSSPWHRRLKMLGKKTPGSTESLSQGTFVKFLLPHISSDPVNDMDVLKRGKTPRPRNQCIFNEYFLNEQDSVILKILMNVFKAVQQTWPDEWENPNISILTKTTGFAGIMKALPVLVGKGKSERNLSLEYFAKIFYTVREELERKNIRLTSDDFPPSASSEHELQKIIENIAGKI
ncbi:MAG: DGQHR domain-containing protein [Candidatus Omnitrophica bacterium]|nr:DGQHR domain-containing protein [Candidatus Omnitrophota bacterium]